MNRLLVVLLLVFIRKQLITNSSQNFETPPYNVCVRRSKAKHETYNIVNAFNVC